MAVCEWREREGLRYLHYDFRDATEDGFFGLLDAARPLVEEDPAPRLLCLVGATTASPAWLKVAKELNLARARDDLRVAVVGADRRQRSLLAAMNFAIDTERFVAFDDETDALDWLRRI